MSRTSGERSATERDVIYSDVKVKSIGQSDSHWLTCTPTQLSTLSLTTITETQFCLYFERKY